MEEEEEILADLIPCEVLLPNGQMVKQARVWISQRGVVVYQEATRGDAQRVYAARHLLPPEIDDVRKPKRRQRHTVTTSDGALIINPVLGCLCHYPALRTYTFADVRADTRSM